MPPSQIARAILPVAGLALIALLTQLPHPRCRAALKFRVIFGSPGGLLALQKMQQLAAPHLLAGRFQQKGATPTRPHQGIDFPQQIARNQNVCPLCALHMCIVSVL